MADEDEPTDAEATGNGEEGGDDEQKSFRERVEEIREKRAEEGEGEGPPEDRREEMMGGGPGGGPGGAPGGMGGGGNPFAQMMGGMMGGGPGGGPGGRGQEGVGNEELVQEVRQLRDEMRDQTRALKRIADALEDD